MMRTNGECSAEIIMNPFDNMVFATITNISEDHVKAQTEFVNLCQEIEKEFGAKCLMKIPDRFKSFNLMHTSAGTKRALTAPIKIISFPEEMPGISKRVQQHFEKIGKEEGYQLLVTPKEYEEFDLYEKLYEFKKENATFVT